MTTDKTPFSTEALTDFIKHLDASDPRRIMAEEILRLRGQQAQFSAGSSFNQTLMETLVSDFQKMANLPLQPEHKAAIATLERLGYTWNGGQLWKPPIGKDPTYITGEQPILASIPEAATLTNINDLCPLDLNLSQTDFATGWNSCCQFALVNGRIPPVVKGVHSVAQGWNACRLAMINQAPVKQPSSKPKSELLQRAEKLAEDTAALAQRVQVEDLRDKVRSEHAEWAAATFGNTGPVGPLKHLSAEALETASAPDDLSEWADMQFLFWDAQRKAGVTDEQITAAMVEKLKINKARQWPEPKEGEPQFHIKGQ